MFLIIERSSSSPITFTPRVRAFSSFDPASEPARTKLVFLLTPDAIFPPAASIRREASSLVRDGSVPVRTKVIPRRGPDRGAAATGFAGSTPAARRSPTRVLFTGWLKWPTMASAMVCPMPAIRLSLPAPMKSSNLDCERASRVPNRLARSFAAAAPTCGIPSP